MSVARPGDPAKDLWVVQRFREALAVVAGVMRDVLADEAVLRNLGQGTLDEGETSLRETRIEVDRGLAVFAKRRTIRLKQSVGGATGTLSKRMTDLEAAVAALQGTSIPEHQPMCMGSGPEEGPEIAFDDEEGDNFISAYEDAAEAADDEVSE